LVGGLLLIILAAFVLSGKIKHPKATEATEFLLKDDMGHPVARLGRQAGGTCLTLTANDSLAQAKLCAFDGSDQSSSSSYLLLTDGDGVSRASLSAGPNTRDARHSINSGLFILRKYLNEKFLNLNLGTDTELVIGEEGMFSVFPTQAGVPVPRIDIPRVIISVPGHEPAINIIDDNGQEAWSTKKK
jgi:hypothetical protein